MEARRRLLVKSKVNYDRKVKKSPNDDVVRWGPSARSRRRRVLHGAVVFHAADGSQCDMGDLRVFSHGDWRTTRLEREGQLDC